VGLPPALHLRGRAAGRLQLTGSTGTTATDPTPASRAEPQPTVSPTCPNSTPRACFADLDLVFVA
jgi:hypothetical protein